MSVKDWSSTASSNNTIDGINIAESAPFANMNDMGRAIMANVRQEVADQGTTVTAATLTTISGASQFKILSGGTTISAFDTAVTGLYREMLAGSTLILAPTTALGLTGYTGNVSLEPGALVKARSLGAGNWVTFPERVNGQPVTRFYEDEQAATVTAATVTDVSAAAPFAPLAGTTTIEGYSTQVTGAYRELRVLSTPVLKHDGTTNIVQGGASVTLAADDIVRSRSLGAGKWTHKIDRAAGSYSTGTFTPALKFGGANVGMTTSTLSGSYTRVGDRVIGNISIVLTAKGSSTGNATITGLPITLSSLSAAMTISALNMTGMGGTIKALAIGLGTTVVLYQSSATGDVAISDTVFTNTSQILISFQYGA